MKELHDGTFVEDHVPTRLESGNKRFLRDEDHVVARPSDPELDGYAVRREMAFKNIDGEGMDAMRKALEKLYAEAEYLVPPVEFEEYMAKVDAIKDANPKPRKEKP